MKLKHSFYSLLVWLTLAAVTAVAVPATTTTKNVEDDTSSSSTDDDAIVPTPHEDLEAADEEETSIDTRIRLDDDTTTNTTNGTATTPNNAAAASAASDPGGLVFQHFIAHDNNMTCSADEHARPFNNQIRGVNLGGWMVLEPWITPSMFYQFLGKGVNTTAFDMYTFCQVLGPTEANRQLKNHWETWVTEEIIQQLADSNAVNSLRLPLGDFQFVPYGPYLDGCIDGGLDYVDALLDWCYARGLTVLLDIHTMKDSQNGFDNSGQVMGFEWTSALSSEFAGLTTFEHWPIRTAKWVGTFDPKTASYTSINYENIKHALAVVEKVVERYGKHPAVLGLEPMNEPWQYTPIKTLKRFYWEGYKIVKRAAPYWKYVMHDSFRLDPNIWGGFMDGCPERALDTHIYQAWRDPDSRLGFFTDACGAKSIIATMEREFGPVIVGEWSLATDNCAMWLNGFNDNLPGFPRLPCKYTPCMGGPNNDEPPYQGVNKQPGVPIDPSKPIQGPYGSGMSGPVFGLCPGSRDWYRESSGHPLTGQDWIRAPPRAPKHQDDTDLVMTKLAQKKIAAFSGIGHGFFFWNFRTDLYEPQWSYMAALDRGWIPSGNLNDETILDACAREDKAEFKCVLKPNQIDRAVLKAAKYCLKQDNKTNTEEGQKILHSSGKELSDAVGPLITEYFKTHRSLGATCDFGGIAMLVEQNRTITDEDPMDWEENYYVVVNRGPPVWELVVGGIFIALLAGLGGFVIAMRRSPGFNRRVRSNPLFMPITKSHNSLVRSSLNLPDLGYDEVLNDHHNAPKW